MYPLLVLLLLIPALAVPCGTPCDKLGMPGIITQEGVCQRVSETCSISDFYWDPLVSTTSSLTFRGEVNCACGEIAPCNITVGSRVIGMYSTNLTSGYQVPNPGLSYGTNRILLKCQCPMTNATCEQYADDVRVQAEVRDMSSTSPVSPGHIVNTTFQVKNLGNIRSRYRVDSYLYQVNSCGGPPGAQIPGSQSTGYFDLQPAGKTGDFELSLFSRNLTCQMVGFEINNFTACDEAVGCPKYSWTGGCLEARECYDYGGAWPSSADCIYCKGVESGPYTCSSFHCCLAYKHYENGICCDLGQKCCASNTECPDGYRCDIGLSYCVARAAVGFPCRETNDCESNLHCDANATLTAQGRGYCTWNDTDAAGLGQSSDPAKNGGTANAICLDEEEWNQTMENYGCDGCASSFDCGISGFYCDSRYAFCRRCPTGSESADGVCDGAPSFQCQGYDLDCCSTDAQCSGLGSDYFCDTDARVCRQCLRRQDFWCSSSQCYGIDPDCCATGGSCPAGTVCSPSGNCVPQAGRDCSTNSDCGAGTLRCEYSSCFKKKVCVAPRFINMQPTRLTKPLAVGKGLPLTIVVTNPQGCASEYKLTFSGTGKYFTRFAARKSELMISLNPAETKVIPATFSAGIVGNYVLSIVAQDIDNPELTDTVNFDIQVIGTGTKESGNVVVAPEIGISEILILLAAGIYSSFMR